MYSGKIAVPPGGGGIAKYINKNKKYLHMQLIIHWKRCKHSGHFSKFRIIIGNFCIVNQKCYVLKLKLINYTYNMYYTFNCSS
jgi:hypothetical protein